MRLLAMWLVLVTPAVIARASPPDALRGHGGPIMAVAFTGDGRALTASFDNSVGLWKGGSPRWLEGHEAAVKTVIALPGDRAASGADDFAVIVWDLRDGAIVHRLEGHRGAVAGLAVSPDGATLASAGWDGRIGLWSLEDGRLQRWIEGHEGQVTAVAFAEGGRVLYSASADGTIRSWDTATGAPMRVEARHGFGVNRILIDEAEGWLAYGAVDGGTRAFSLATGETLADLTLERRPILALTASPDRRLLAVGDGEGWVMVVDTADWSIRHDFLAAERGPVWALAMSPEGDRLLAGGIDDAAAFWPIEGAAGPRLGLATRSFLTPASAVPNGERQFQRKCSICHTLTGDGGRKAGPTFANLFGRPAGEIDGYRYSDTLTDSDIVWSAETLDALFDLGPDHYIPGSKMPMQRITSAADRRDLIDYLRRNTVE